MGYKRLAAGEIAKAIDYFEFNVTTYPESSNAYDSLGEAYMKARDNARARANYERSLELNPKNTNARAMLKRLEAESDQPETR